MTNKKDFFNAIQERRSIYTLSKETTLSENQLHALIKDAIKHTPSSFNSQSSRVVLLLGDHHNQLWDLTKETLRKIVPKDQFSTTEERINGFRNGYGTVLFFEDQRVIEGLQEQFALYKDNFPIWSLQSCGMLQYVVWTSFAIEGLGASLQHYNPLIDDEVKSKWDIPKEWKLLAQMPFGKSTAPAGDKVFNPIDERFKAYQ